LKSLKRRYIENTKLNIILAKAFEKSSDIQLFMQLIETSFDIGISD
jgi:hypothetical protein